MTRVHRRAVILSMGDELTLGQSLDTNSRWIARRLVEAGIVPIAHVTLPDDLPAIVDEIGGAARRADLIIGSGGLGPTADDLTRDALAKVTGDPLVEDAGSLEAIRAWFRSRGRAMLEVNAVQARRPSRATPLPNRHGTAPGLRVEIPGPGGPVDCFCLPGPPSEMAPMFEQSVLPHLRPPAGARIIQNAIHVVGLGESEVAARLGDLMRRDASTLVGTTASRGIVTVRVRCEITGPAHAGVPAEVEQVEDAIRRAVAGHILYEGDQTPPERLVAELRDRGLTLGVAESCTGGLLGAEITAVPGSSGVFLGGWIAYSNTLKVGLLGVLPETLARHGAVSERTAAEMAAGGLARSEASMALAVTGIAGPAGGEPSRPIGTVFISLARRDSGALGGVGAGHGQTRRFQFVGSRETIRQWTVNAALVMGLAEAGGEKAPALLREVPIEN